MAQDRASLQALLLELVSHVYFQPPDNMKLEYPCILYKRDNAQTRFADDLPYSIKNRYMITIIDRDPENEISKKVALLPSSTFSRSYTADGLYHDVYNIYF